MSIPKTHDAETFREHVSRGTLYQRELEIKSRDGEVPIIGSHIGSFLHLLVKATNAKRILELGTANGYSTIWMAMALDEMRAMGKEPSGDDERESEADGMNIDPGRILTIEWEPGMMEEAASNIKKAGYSHLVEQRQGDARRVVEELKTGSYDFIFIDVEKEYYSELLDPAIRLLRPGGLLVYDNTAFVTAGDFLERATGHPDIDPFHFYGFMPRHGPEWDAVTLAVKK